MKLKILFILILFIPLAYALPRDMMIEDISYGADIYSGFLLSDNNASDNCMGFFCMINYVPSMTKPIISPLPAEATDDLQCLMQNYEDYEDGNISAANYTEWFVNGVLVATDENLSESLILGNDKVICSKIANDSEGYQTLRLNSSELTIGDNVPPQVTSHVIIPNPISFGAYANFCVNVTDGGSDIETCTFELYKQDYALPTFQVTADLKNGNQYCKTYTPSGSQNFIVEWRKSYCWDTSGNLATNNSVNLNLTYSSGSVSSSGGGGGTPKTCNTSGTAWDIRTLFGQLSYNTGIPYNNAKPVERELIITNSGNFPINVKLSCEKTDSEELDICKYITFTNSSFSVPPNSQEPFESDMLIAYPEGSVDNEFSFNIIASDGQYCNYKLENTAYISRWLTFGKWRQIYNPDGSPFYYLAIIPSIIIWLIFLGIGIVVAKKKDAPFLGIVVIGMMLGFVGFTVSLYF